MQITLNFMPHEMETDVLAQKLTLPSTIHIEEQEKKNE